MHWRYCSLALSDIDASMLVNRLLWKPSHDNKIPWKPYLNYWSYVHKICFNIWQDFLSQSSQTRSNKIGYYKPHIGLNFGRQQHWWDTYQISKWLKISKHESHLFKTLQYVTIRWLMKYWNHPCWSGSFATHKVNKAILSSYFFFFVLQETVGQQNVLWN